VLRHTTGTFGVRETAGHRFADARRMEEVVVTGCTVRMKVGPERAKPEREDVTRAAVASGLPAHEVASRAEEAWRRVSRPRDES
ncbi:MAG: nickel insertion protein, partial [Acidimicrobiales bacterium]